MGKIKVMHFVSGLVAGGVEEMLYNYCKFMDPNKYEFIVVYQHESVPVCKEKFESLNIKCIRVVSRRKSIIQNILSSMKVIELERPDIIHTHMNLMNFCALLAGKIKGVKVRISHSHIAEHPNNIVKKVIYKVCKILCKISATNYLACGKDAGEFLYGHKLIESRKVEIISNAIDLLKFSPNDELRIKIRSKYKLDDKFVIGHVGRFTEQKNHTRLLSIFSEVIKKKPNSVLLLIGSGELEDRVKKFAEKLKINDKVIFFGTTSRMSEIYNAMDVFVLPSLYEGYPVVSTEVQAAQLPSVFSDKIDKTCKLTKYIDFLSLEDDDCKWVDTIFSVIHLRNTGEIEELYKRFDVRTAQLKLDALYSKYVERVKDKE